ncbi:MAG: UDP-glucose/GDP-mannose dehydrogenase family protein [Candidatus Krumholzibacteria bacterium]|jgi:UDPglucose 6-dehydrogenase|nr:UDP-glucose/GDP-mannose dehydrogenase family protein [Candidatus Krumholzibacteria bacterium]
MSRTLVIGTGYVGLVSGACMADFGNRVTCYDIAQDKIDTLNRGEVSFYEPGLEDLVRRNVDAGRLSFSSDLVESVESAVAIFIAVGTPEREDGSADLDAVFSVARDIGRNLKGYKIVVQKSTVPVGTTRRVGEIMREEAGPDADFDLVSNPEFLREGSAINDFMRPNRVVLGFDGDRAREVVKEIYRPLYLNETPVLATSLETAEMVKYASNAFLAAKISFINEVAEFCEKVGADVQVVARGMGMDQRIGSKFLHAGAGFGGSCFPKDTQALLHMGTESGVKMGLVRAAIEANERQPLRAVEKMLRLSGGSVDGLRIAVLGLSFKPNTDDVRDAAALKIIEGLEKAGATVCAFDPVASKNARLAKPDLELADSLFGCIEGADGLVIATEWNEFRVLDLEKVARLMANPRVVDCRNIYRRKQMESLGFAYASFGREQEES